MNGLISLNSWAENKNFYAPRSAQGYMRSEPNYFSPSSCGSSCGSGEAKPQPSACGSGDSQPMPSACGAGDESTPKPSACGAGDDSKPKSACGSGCGTGGK